MSSEPVGNSRKKGQPYVPYYVCLDSALQVGTSVGLRLSRSSTFAVDNRRGRLMTLMRGSTDTDDLPQTRGLRMRDLSLNFDNHTTSPPSGGLAVTNGGSSPSRAGPPTEAATTAARDASRDARGVRLAAPSATASSLSPMSTNGGTIEDQIRQVDKIVKECEHSRKSLEQISRRLDELNDEVKRYREFLGHEKARRDPALYKTNNVDRPSAYNESICGTMSNLTQQLTMEWSEKLRGIHNTMQSPPPSTPGSRSSDRTG